ncbi:MAG: hypothetical protein JSS21_00975, partial [Proteobacteria bacterium]|nr:hypothetical protein [Pseudomonadota bacterium]
MAAVRSGIEQSGKRPAYRSAAKAPSCRDFLIPTLPDLNLPHGTPSHMMARTAGEGMHAWRRLLWIALSGLSGCVSVAAHYIEQPGHNRPSAQFVKVLEDSPPNYQARDFHTGEGLRIAYWYGMPQALDITDKIVIQPGSFSANFSWNPPQSEHPPPPARGSVVLLHSWGLDATQMVYWGLHFTNAGYVVV